jgi:putative DNA primase/helicase
MCPVEYDKNAVCPTWDRFLIRITDNNQGLISYIQGTIGYALTGSTREQCMFILWGEGQNGKTTLLETIKTVYGDYATQMPTDTLMVRRAGGIPNDVARLTGVRLVSASETSATGRLDEELVKRLTGEDTVTARFLYREYFEFQPQFKIFLACNHKPVIVGDDFAIWRRVRLIPFTVRISESEKDKELLRKLRTELPGILRWAVKGCLAWQREGLGEPPEVCSAVEDYRREMDAIGEFLTESCVCRPGASVGATPLYEVYCGWCKRNGEVPQTRTAFGRIMSSKGYTRDNHPRSRRVVYRGIDLEQGAPSFDYSQEEQHW